MKTLPLILSVVMLMAGCAMAPVSTPSEPAPRRCDAAASQALVGSHVGAVDFAPGAKVRIVCTTCPATLDHQPDRLNVRFDQASGIIRTVDCG